MKITIDTEDINSVAAAIAAGLTQEAIVALAEQAGGEWPEIVEGALVVEPELWLAADESGVVMEYTDVDCGEDAAQQYVDTGDWDDASTTAHICVWTWRRGVSTTGETVRVDRESHTIAIGPTEPECDSDDGHDWHPAPWGLSENPGVQGHGGGVIIEERCSRCGCKKVTDTWATGPSGEQGLTSVSYSNGEDE